MLVVTVDGLMGCMYAQLRLAGFLVIWGFGIVGGDGDGDWGLGENEWERMIGEE